MISTKKKEHNSNDGYRSDLFDARSQKDEAFANLEAHRIRILLQARHIFLEHLLQNSSVTPDDIRGKVDLPVGINPTCLGPVPTHFARSGIIYRKGFVESTRKEAHARPVSVWGLLDREKAEKWIQENPLPQASSGEVAA